MLEDRQYYPYGLGMAGISDKAVKTQYALNKYRYNGKELQNQEFNDGSGLEEYDYGARFQDPQIGRWHVPDPFATKFVDETPYGYAGNNPEVYTDVEGKFKYPKGKEQQYAGIYKILTSYLQNRVQNLLKSQSIQDAFKRYGHLSPDQLQQDFIWGKGAEIRIVDKLDRGQDENAKGYTDPVKGNYIELNTEIVKLLEAIGSDKNMSAEAKDAALLVVISILLHEENHRGDILAGRVFVPVMDEEDEVGWNFDRAIYGVDVDGYKVLDFDFNAGLGEEDWKKKVIEGAERIGNQKNKKGEGQNLPKMNWDQVTEWISHALDVNPNIKVTIN